MKKKTNLGSTKTKKNKEISRKEALRRVGKYAAVSAAAMIIVLDPLKAQSTSPPNPGEGW
jgi:hypothetical protein